MTEAKRNRKTAAPRALASPLGLLECRRAPRLDPEASTVLGMLNAARVRHPTVREDRAQWRAAAVAFGRHDAIARVESHRIDGPHGPIDLVLYHPDVRDGPAPAFVWFHGGGFVIGGPATADTICRHLARQSGAIVVAVRYRLVPEHDLYAGREDCVAALDWIARHGGSVGIDPTRLAVGGDSAGGNLAAAVAQRSADGRSPPLRLQVLAYPATNLRDDFESKRENADGYLLTAKIVDANKALLRKRADDLGDPWLSPALANDLRGLPPALVVSAGYDPIRDDGLIYLERLRAAGVAVEHLHYAGQFHGFLNFAGVLRAARDGLDRIGTALRRALAGEPGDALDRTLELSARPHDALQWPAVRLGAGLMIGWMMLGERLESLRTSATRRWLPDEEWIRAIDESPLLNPAHACRAMVADRYAPIVAHETWRRERRTGAAAM